MTDGMALLAMASAIRRAEEEKFMITISTMLSYGVDEIEGTSSRAERKMRERDRVFSCQVLFSSLWCLWSIFFSLSLSCLIFLFILSTLFIFNSSFSIILVALPGATRPHGLGTWNPMQCSKLVSNHTSLQPVFIYIYRSFMCFLLLSLSLCVKGMWRVGF